MLAASSPLPSAAVTPQDFENQLRALDRIGTRVRVGPRRETWRFDYNDRPHYLHFYRRGKVGTGRIGTGAAAAEFAGLTTLQELKIPAIRGVGLLAGFTLAGEKGDAVITLGVDGVRLNEALNRNTHRQLLLQMIDWLRRLRDAELGHDDLRPESFLVVGDELLLADAAALTKGGLSRLQLQAFAHRAEPWLSRADRLRVWRALVGDEDLPPPRYAEFIRKDQRELDIGTIDAGDWKGRFRRGGNAVPWSIASKMRIELADWQREWPRLLALINADGLDVLKRDSSGDILSGVVSLAGRPIDIIVKRPKNKFWYRSLLNVFRRSRARRLWDKTWSLIVRNIAVEVPLLVMERRTLGYPADSLAVFERVPGPTLAAVDLDTMTANERDTFFRRCGKLLRRIEDTGLTHTDAKSTNWIVFQHPFNGPTPVLVDAYGIRKLNAFLQLFGIRRLLRAMKTHPQYTPADSLAICLGFSPQKKPGEVPAVEDEHA